MVEQESGTLRKADQLLLLATGLGVADRDIASVWFLVEWLKASDYGLWSKRKKRE